MKLIINRTPQFIVVEKPYGLTTHKVDDYKNGFKEFLEQKTGIDLAIISRLDATTSGLILFPRKEFAGSLNTLWQSDACVKTYLFITDRPFQPNENSPVVNITVKSFIEQKISPPTDKSNSKYWSSDPDKAPNAISEFTFLKTIETGSGKLFLWQAKIKTGKTHQIRLHAQNLQIPILGDIKYSGTPYFRIALHCCEIQIEGEKFSSSSPFEKIAAPEFPFISEFEKRSRLYDVQKNECFRWLHNEIGNYFLDQYGSFLVFYVYMESGTNKNRSPQKLNRESASGSSVKINSIETAKKMAQWISDYFSKSIFLKPMYDRGHAPQKNDLFHFDYTTQVWANDFPVQNWIAEENEVKFKLKSHHGQSPGLFLDQRENRNWVLHNSKNMSVLNLFSYTGGFSVCAAKGGAAQVTTVDLSKSFIQWCKENFLLNDLTLLPEYQFWSADTLHFLKGAINKQRTWDLIICDPPTFGRSDKGTFQIDKDIDSMIQSCFQCLTINGRILFSTNYEKWNLESVYQRIQMALAEKKYKFVLEKTPYQSLDFDLPSQNGKMKSLFIKKNCLDSSLNHFTITS